jgi:FlaA1/EpsC-like NDP-sugar epimerase
MREVMQTFGIQTVYHAAAYKHVPITEVSVVAAARTNILGTVEAIRAAREVSARFLLVSSDKAAQPRSVMGATKRLAEFVATYQRSRLFRPVVVRFGNILGSSGSVVEIMLRHVTAGLPIPITDPDATRFFMTADEAVALVLKADLLAEHPEVFWLDMGAPIRIGDLAERIIEHAIDAGLPPVGVEVIGLRAGEKVREELTAQGLAMKPTADARILSAAQPDVAADAIQSAVQALTRACAEGDGVDVIKAVSGVVSDYVPSAAALANALTDVAHMLATEREPAPAKPRRKVLRDIATRHRRRA